jgi:hypothetical protein
MKSLAPAVAAAVLLPLVAGELGAQLPIDGHGHHSGEPTWGAAGTPLLRTAPASYGDGQHTPAGENRPSARLISNVVCAQGSSLPNAEAVTDFVWQWGQFLDHDLDLTDTMNPAEAFDVSVPKGDPWFDPSATGTAVIGLSRSHWILPDGIDWREQVNAITSWIDASMVYGSDPARALALRTLDGTGRLKTSAGNLLPFNVDGLPNAPTASDPTLFVAGDVRANEQVCLTAMHTLFVREHNSLADTIRAAYPFLTGDAVYEIARQLVAYEIQAITYREFLPVVLGVDALPAYSGWDPSVNASIANEFSAACFRFGHTMLSPELLRLDADWQPLASGPLPLGSAFFSPGLISDEGIEPFLRGLSAQRPQEVDTLIVDGVRNFLFGQPGQGGFDLASLNLQRGRDHGLASYNETRVAYGLAPKANFGLVSDKPGLVRFLTRLYGSPNNGDLWVCALAEAHVPGALVGETIRAVLTDQFRRLRDGDPFWYQATALPDLPAWVEAQTLSAIIARNTDITGMQENAFELPLP